MTFRQQLLSSSNCYLLFSASGRHREQQIVVDVAQLVGHLVSVHDTLTLVSCRILTASRIHLVVLSDSQFAVLYGDLWRRTANSSSRKTAAAVETSLKI